MKDIHEQFVFYGKKAREWMRKCELLLPEIERRRIWKKRGYKSVYEYAAKLAGMSTRKVDDCLWILRKIEDKPAILKVAEEKGLNSVRPIATLATQENEKFWAEKARLMSQQTLRSYSKEFRVNPKAQPGKVAIQMELDPKIADKLRKIKGDGDWNSLMEEFLKLREGKLEKEKPEPVETDSRHIPNKIKKYVLELTNHKCAYPNCNKDAEHFHHTNRFALDKKHDPDTIVPLCKNHHSLAHLGLIENEEKRPDFWHAKLQPDTTSPKYKIDELIMEYG